MTLLHSPGRQLLEDLCRLSRIETSFLDWTGKTFFVSDEVLIKVLAALGIDASTQEAAQAAITRFQTITWERMVPATTVIRQGWTPWVYVHVPHGQAVELHVACENGEIFYAKQIDRYVDPHMVNGVLIGEATFELPGDIPLGYHTLVAHGPHIDPSTNPAACGSFIVAPQHIALPARLQEGNVRGIAAQLYQLRSDSTVGLGDLGSLQELLAWSAKENLDTVLINPIHAPDPVSPLENSPYRPSSRQFRDPNTINLHHKMFGKPDKVVQRVLKEGVQLNTSALLDRDLTWKIKREALQTLFNNFQKSVGNVSDERFGYNQQAFAQYRSEQGKSLELFATWNALAGEFGLPWQNWPVELQDAHSQAVADWAHANETAITWHCWLQWVIDVQLRDIAHTAKDMKIGIMHDLAVGVHPEGADAWVYRNALAHTMSVGAPQDQYSILGQNWHQPPWLPHKLEELGYEPWRNIVSAVLRHSGGLRIDHILGLFRLWWVPTGLEATQGTYVNYNEEAMLGILALEAHRADVVIVGEDLGTVPPHCRQTLTERGLLGTSISWFEREGQGPLHPDRYRQLCLASLTTHDLPPTIGYLQLEHVYLRHSLKMLSRPIEEEIADELVTINAYIQHLYDQGFLHEPLNYTEQGVVTKESAVTVMLALHRWLGTTTARIRLVALADIIGDSRPINQPGTDKEYANWCFPLLDFEGNLGDMRSLDSAFAKAMMQSFT